MTKSTAIRITYIVFTLLLLAAFLANMGCGYREAARFHCHLGNQACDTLFGENTWETNDRLSNVEQNVANLNAEILSLQTTVQLMISDSADKTLQIAQLNSLIYIIENTVNNNAVFVTAALNDLTEQINDLEASIAYEQTRINDLFGDMAELQLNDSIVEYVLPCGDRANAYDEALLKTKSGQLIAYFESGNGQGNQSRFLTVLTPGSYVTTDGGHCYFTIDSSGQITNAHR